MPREWNGASIGALVVSDRGTIRHDSQYPADVVTKVLLAAGPNSPMIYLPVSDNTMVEIQSRIDSLNISKEEKQRFRDSLVQIDSPGFAWQQDYMQPFVNPKTGQALFRKVEGYNRQQDGFARLVKESSKCGFAEGPELKVDGQIKGGHSGGNIDTLPSDICLLGDDNFESETQWSKYADQICGTKSSGRIMAPTAWLGVGHTDEIIKVIRNKSKMAPCDFTVAIASPRKALELLKAHPSDRFLDFKKVSNEKLEETTNRRTDKLRGLSYLCRTGLQNREGSPSSSRERKPTASNIWRKRFWQLGELLFGNASARLFVGSGPVSQRDLGSECPTLTNDEVYKLINTDSELKIYNELVQEQMDQLKDNVKARLKTRLPQCETDILELPDLFYGGQSIEIAPNKFELPRRMGASILPNPANSISINDTVISPEPGNSTFKKFIEDEYKKRGLASDFVDTFDFAHIGNGNLHCTTTTVHMCKPRGDR